MPMINEQKKKLRLNENEAAKRIVINKVHNMHAFHETP